LLDLRASSTTNLEHQAFVLDEDNRDAVYISPGVAHGYDPACGIPWPLPMTVFSEAPVPT
jgi:dTDP-4-dehydrorhamnose 3,5-epimerase